MKIARLMTLSLVAAALTPGAMAQARSGPVALRWLTSEPEALRVAAASGRPVLVDFWADWCAPCAALDRYVWSDPRVRQEATRFVLLKIDGSAASTAVSSGEFDRVARSHGIEGLPTVLLIDASGRELDRIEGVVSADEMLRRLRAAERSCRAARACS